MKNCSRVLSRSGVAEKSNCSVQMDRLSPSPVFKPCLYLYNYLTLSISIFFPPLVILPSRTTGPFASLLSPYPPLWQLLPTFLCCALFLLFFLGINTTSFFSFYSSPGTADIGNMAPVFLSLLCFFYSCALHRFFLLFLARSGN